MIEESNTNRVISDATAKTQVARILQKLWLRHRVQALILAYEWAWSSADRPDPRRDKPMAGTTASARARDRRGRGNRLRHLRGDCTVPSAGDRLVQRELLDELELRSGLLLP